MPDRRQTPTVRLRRLAAELRRLRASAEMTREDVAGRTDINVATLYRLETSRVRPQARTLKALLDLYGVTSVQRDELLALLKEVGRRNWLRTYRSELPEQYTTYIDFEAEARSIWHYESLFVPGLLQTEGYARAVIGGGLPHAGREEIENRVEARMDRQALLIKEDPLRLWVIVDEAALRRRVGGRAVMTDQLHRLRQAAELPNVTLQVIPFDAGAHPGMPGSFVVIQFAEPPASDVVHVDSMAGDLFLEDDAHVRRYSLMFEYLRAVALSPDASHALIVAVAEEL